MATDILFARLKLAGPHGTGSDRFNNHALSAAMAGFAGGIWTRNQVQNRMDQLLVGDGGTALTAAELAEWDLIFDHIETLNANGRVQWVAYRNEPAWNYAATPFANESEFWRILDVTEPN